MEIASAPMQYAPPLAGTGVAGVVHVGRQPWLMTSCAFVGLPSYVAETTPGVNVERSYQPLTYLNAPLPLGGFVIAAVPHGPVISALSEPVAVRTQSRYGPSTWAPFATPQICVLRL